MTVAPLREPLLAEWACLGAVYRTPTHGFAIAKRLDLSGDLGRVWYVSRPLTYRALDQLRNRTWIEPRGEQPGDAGPNRTLLAATASGRARFTAWINTPVAHVRDVRSELLLKVVLADEHHLDIADMLDRQHVLLDEYADALDHEASAASAREQPDGDDVVVAWRREMVTATRRFVAQLRRRHLAAD